jgi:intracellular septation protein
MKQSVKFALDMGPLLVFFVMYRSMGIIPATASLIACTMFSLAITYVMEKRISPVPLISGLAVTIFGGMTIFFANDLFIKIKPTLVNLIFSAILLGGVYYKKPMIKYVFAGAMELTEEGWRILSIRWGVFFIFLAILNEIIWRNFSESFWVDFKVFGMLSLTVIFTLCQLTLVKKYWVEEPKK